MQCLWMLSLVFNPLRVCMTKYAEGNEEIIFIYLCRTYVLSAELC